MFVRRIHVVALSVLVASISFPSIVSAQVTEYGSFRFDGRLPNVLFLVGEIDTGDSFEMRRAMRDHDIRLVVTASGGGNLYEGLQLASILDDKGIATYLPAGVGCESSCANVFFGGVVRRADGELGVHQFYSGPEDATAPERKDITAAETQYTTADIIGIMNSLETPPFVYEKMFSTSGIYYFSDREKEMLARGGEVAGITGLMADVDGFLVESPGIIERPRPEPPTEPQVAATSPSVAPREATPAPLKEISRFDGKDFFGGDLSPKGVRGVSLSDCEQICRDNSSCAAYSYVIETRWCWPKSRVENVSLAEGVVSGIIDYASVNPDIFNRPFLEGTAIDIPGFDMLPDGLRHTSLDQCRRQCEANGSCVASRGSRRRTGASRSTPWGKCGPRWESSPASGSDQASRDLKAATRSTCSIATAPSTRSPARRSEVSTVRAVSTRSPLRKFE